LKTIKIKLKQRKFAKNRTKLETPHSKNNKTKPRKHSPTPYIFSLKTTKIKIKITGYEPNINSPQSSNNSMNKQEENRDTGWSFWYQIHSFLQNSMHGFFLVSHLNQKLIHNTKGESF